jgi:putative membrane protein
LIESGNSMSDTADTSQSRAVPAPRSVKARALLYCKGVAMGMGDAVPGVSGGTIAVITQIYDELIFSLRAIDLQALQLLLRGRLRQLWQHCNGSFLLVLALGILSGLLLSANTVLYLLQYWFEALMAFFVGLVLASCWLLNHECNYRDGRVLLFLLAGITLTVSIGLLDPANGNFSLPAIFLSSAVAICAMILPGLSGAFILLLLGVYEYVLRALIEFNVAVIGVFVLGCVLGLLSFSRLLAWLLRTRREACYAFIIGMLLGSLSVLWPWQHTQAYYTDSSGELHPLQAINVMPFNYTEITGQDPMVGLVFLSLLLGVGVVAGLHRLFANPPRTVN